ncbi:SDR family oxidoreductase [Halopelagius fulvigenes]|uniref:SDR family oxidoreductase n=1 Tax=Halopelagius fulvigenes TaxID=1198324 RepID=A0ABD5TXL9_9EURY
MSLLLDGKTAVVTGGSSGFGRAISRTFARNGADVVVADVTESPREGGVPTAELVRSETDREAYYVECDVRNPADTEVAVEATEELGGIDVMVNNAGIAGDEDFLDVTEAAFERLMAVNVKGTFFGAQAAAKRMLEDGGGTIVNMSSAGGIVGTGDLVAYCASKGAVRLMTYALADRFGGDIRVNAIHPGFSKTQMLADSSLGRGVRGRIASEMLKQRIPSGRYGEPQEIANAALFLASDLSSYVNGESLVVDGGLSHT